MNDFDNNNNYGAPVDPQPQYTQPQQQYAQPQQQYAQPQQPQYAPVAGRLPSGSKSKTTAGLLAIFLGGLGIHKFYLGYTTSGIIMLLVSLLSLGILAGVIGIIALIEGIMYLTKSDAEFDATYVVGDKAWF